MKLYGTVIHGQGRGADLGFPTANLKLETGQAIPETGVYAGLAQLADEPNPRLAAIHIGPRPTFQEQDATVEAHLLDFSGDLYGKSMCLDIRAKLRDVEKFDSIEALQQAIAHDCEQTRELLNT